jgi:M3 family oligoendopeptidase
VTGGILDPVALDEADVARRYAELDARFEAAESPRARRAAFDSWDGLRREWKSWANVTRLRFTQDTRRDECRAAQVELEQRTPAITAFDSNVKQRLLEPEARRPLEDEIGPQAFALWQADVASFDPSLSASLVREAALSREYTEALARANVRFAGADRTLAELGPFRQSNEREVRHGAERARWQIFAERREQLDAIFDELVHLRDGMARRLGDDGYLALGYRRMHRIDYGPDQVARYRDEVVRTVVPLAHDLVRRLGREAGLERVHFWDESTLATPGRVAPRGDRSWVVARAVDALGAMDPALGEFARELVGRNLFDVESRPGKAFGAYCTTVPSQGVPFVFANFDGTRGDVKTLMHELGHAFQAWRSREKPVLDYLFPTLESAEIHSMALEYLSWPEMGRFFGQDADAYRREHLTDALLFLPYGVAVDHFQHLVYTNPSASPEDRNEMWREVERRYLPWRDYGDLEHPLRGGVWQEKRHIFTFPFYYIDYTLALCCALQLWVRAQRDRRGTLDAYVALCGRGGEAPFGELVRGAGLVSPFEAGALEDVVRAASAAL